VGFRFSQFSTWLVFLVSNLHYSWKIAHQGCLLNSLAGVDVPVFDIGKMYQPGEQQDLLVRNARFGTGLAAAFLKDPESKDEAPAPDYAVVLMRRHGYTTHGRDIETAVYRAIYTKINASIQTDATTIRHSFPQISDLGTKFDFEPLTQEMCEGCIKMNEGTQDKPWKLWVAEVEKSPLYINRG
jgi:ribulose-5-phosphate 4-epimerase/fuculose-1-phosphate aldolase